MLRVRWNSPMLYFQHSKNGEKQISCFLDASKPFFPKPFYLFCLPSFISSLLYKEEEDCFFIILKRQNKSGTAINKKLIFFFF